MNNSNLLAEAKQNINSHGYYNGSIKNDDQTLMKFLGRVCGKPSILYCSQGEHAFYCSDRHQIDDRKDHITKGKEIALTRTVLNLTDINIHLILKYKTLYLARNKARREVAIKFANGNYEKALELIANGKTTSESLMKKEPDISYFLIDFILDCLLEVGIGF